MLALKGVLSASDRISVIVFDEIDANIGGRLGSVIGGKLRELAGTAPKVETKSKTKARAQKASGANPSAAKPALQHQVLCITHLPQIAAFADRHFHIVKSVHGKGASRTTQTTVNVLEGAKRIDELAEMMAGSQVTVASRAQAQELRDAAQAPSCHSLAHSQPRAKVAIGKTGKAGKIEKAEKPMPTTKTMTTTKTTKRRHASASGSKRKASNKSVKLKAVSV